MVSRQLTFFEDESPAFDRSFAALRRIELADGAWLEHAPGWLQGHARLFDALERTTRWRSERREMYERVVDVPRLYAVLPRDGPGHPLLDGVQSALEARYGTALPNVSLGLYRSGADSVAWHGDYVARKLPDALVATVSVGAPRKFLMRRVSGGPSRSLNLGWGDLLVMGGTCQRTWQHCVPKQARAEPRIAIMFRPEWQEV